MDLTSDLVKPLKKLIKYAHHNRLMTSLDNYERKQSPNSTLIKNRLLLHNYNIKKSQKNAIKSSKKLISTSLDNPIMSRYKKDPSTCKNHSPKLTSFKISQNNDLGKSISLFRFNSQIEKKKEGSELFDALKLRTKTYSPHLLKMKNNRKTFKFADIKEITNLSRQEIENSLQEHLIKISKNSNVPKLRIYKQHLRNLYNLRYKKQQITNFLECQIITQYNQQLTTIDLLYSLTMDEIMMFSFLTFDLNKDGLICNNDLFQIASLGRLQNHLVNQDVIKMFQFAFDMEKYQLLDDLVSQDITLVENLTITQYRAFKFSQEKEKVQQASLSKIISSIRSGIIQSGTINEGKQINQTSKVNIFKKHFMFKNDINEQSVKINKFYQKLNQDSKELNFKSHSFKLNFKTFKKIFSTQIPQIIFDILYVITGLRIPGKNYFKMQYELAHEQKIKKSIRKIDKADLFAQKLKSMKNSYKKTRIEKFSQIPVVHNETGKNDLKNFAQM